MFFNQELRVGLTAGLASLTLAVTGCSFIHHRTRPAQAAPAAQAPAPVAQQGASSGADQTATEAAVSHGDESAAPAAGASAEPALTRDAINPGAPMRYTVKRGDTLWAISTMYLRD
ncbi:MAG TPA: LysM peptidoglycan-binding domain-containing protein, partial [Steroidobacteraceae bacterium]